MTASNHRKYKIGNSIETVYGNLLTIEGIHKTGEGRKTRLILKVSCNICSKDEVLFPESFSMRTSDFTKKLTPCECGGHYKFSETQNAVRLSRKCEEVGKVFLGYNGEYVGYKTNIITYCNDHKTFHKTTSISSFLQETSVSCMECGNDAKSEATTTPYDEVVRCAVATGKYLNGTEFIKLEDCWEITCPSCSHDYLVQSGFCTGKFPTTAYDLKRGRRPCRCSGSYKYSKEQSEFRIKQEMKSETRGDTFLSWGSNYTNVDSPFHYLCGNGHGEKVSTVNLYLNAKARCRECYDERCGFGLYKDRLDEEDNLYIIRLNSLEEDFTKIGRAFDLNKRFIPYKQHYDVSLLATAKGTHKEIYKLEGDLHSKYREYRYTPVVKFAGSHSECFNNNIMRHEEEINSEISKVCEGGL